MRRQLRDELPALTRFYGITPRQLEHEFTLAEVDVYLAYLHAATTEEG